MSEISKKVALFEKSSNNNNNKNEKFKNREKKLIKRESFNKNNNKIEKIINSEKSKNEIIDFQSKLSMFQPKETNNENKQAKNKNVLKEKINEKKDDPKSLSDKNNKNNKLNNKNSKKDDEQNIQDKINFFNKFNEENMEKDNKKIEKKITFQEKINMFTNNNKKENVFKEKKNNLTNNKSEKDLFQKKQESNDKGKNHKENNNIDETNKNKIRAEIKEQINNRSIKNNMENLHPRKSMPINLMMENQINDNSHKKLDIKNNDALYSSKNINVNYNDNFDNDINSDYNKIPRKSVILPDSFIFQNIKDTIGEIFLESEIIPESVVNETFCMGFFVTSFNIDNPQIIENSTEYSADCGHNICTLAQAIKPEIIFRYPENNTKDFEISELSASICFPNGIKICFNKNEMHIKPLKTYSNVLTNQNGAKYYMVSYHYYLQIPINELNTDNNYYKALDNQIINEIKSNKYVYIPHCISLLTKYPFFDQIKKCLECMRLSLQNYKSNPSEIYDIIIYFIKSIPIPPVGTKLFFPIPYCKDLITINQPFYKDYILFGDNPIILLEYLSVDEIILLFRLLLFEQKVIIVGNDYDVITQLTYNLLLLLYPLQWTHTYISIMTETAVKYLQSFLPFLIGMHISLYELAYNIIFSIKESNIFIFDINKHTFEMNTNPDLNTKNVKKQINEKVPKLPKYIYNIMNFGLGVMKSYYEQKKEPTKYNINNTGEILTTNIKIRQVFIRTFLEILYDYKNYLSVIGGKPIFNTKALLENRSKNESNFYKELTETQSFQWFIQNNPVNVSKKDETFFEEQLRIYFTLSNKNEFREVFINNCLITCDIYKHFCIRFENFGKSGSNINKKINNKNDDLLTISDYKRIINQKYFSYESYFKPNIIHKDNKSIIRNKIIFDLNKIPCNYEFFIIPNQEFNFEVEKRRKSIIKNRCANLLSNIKNENDLSLEEKDDIKENICNILTKIFKNEEIKDVEQNKKLIMDSLNTDYGRDLYTDILYQNSNISNESSFQFLNDIISNSITKLLKMKKSERKMTYIVKLVKCCFNFRKEGYKRLYLSDILIPKFQKYPIISELEFWKEWTLLYIDKQKDENNINIKWEKSLKNLMIVMPKFGLNKSVIYSTIADLAKENIKDEPMYLSFMKEIASDLKILKYY